MINWNRLCYYTGISSKRQRSKFQGLLDSSNLPRFNLFSHLVWIMPLRIFDIPGWPPNATCSFFSSCAPTPTPEAATAESGKRPVPSNERSTHPPPSSNKRSHFFNVRISPTLLLLFQSQRRNSFHNFGVIFWKKKASRRRFLVKTKKSY